MPTRVFHRLFSPAIPFLNSNGRNLDLRRARLEWSYGRTSRLLLERRLSAQSYDLLHFHTQVQAYGSVSIMRDIPTVITTDMTALQTAREVIIQYPKTFRLNVQMDQRVFQAAAHIVSFSEWARQSIIDEYGIHPKKVTALPPGAALKTFLEPRYDKRVRPKILFVGGDFKRKGGWDLLEVFTKHFSGRAELHLVTNEPIPNGTESVYVHAGIAAYTDEWHSLYRDADIFALPSYADATPQALQEAAGYGLAILGSRVGGIPEIVLDGVNGFLVDPGNKDQLVQQLARLIDDSDELTRLRHRSRQLACESFDADTNVRRLADLFQEVAQLHTKQTV